MIGIVTQVQISPTFYKQLFYTQVLFVAFLIFVVTIWVCNFLVKESSTKAACMLNVGEIDYRKLLFYIV